jgi:hypothetical protein
MSTKNAGIRHGCDVIVGQRLYNERSRNLETRAVTRSIPSHASRNWYEEFGLPPRFPCIPFDKICELSRCTQEPQIFLRGTETDKTDIIIRLPLCPSAVPPKMRKAYSKHGVTLSKAFEDILWQKLDGGGDTIWSEITGLVMKVYRQAWRQWFRLQYVGHFHPGAELMFERLNKELALLNEKSRLGRHQTPEADLASTNNRYDALLPICKLIHEASRIARATAKATNNVEMARKQIRRAIWEQVRRSVHGMPGDGYIFDGTAFAKIRPTARLHDPKTWKPYQLAIALIAIEREEKYQTIGKKIVPTKRNSKRA